MKKNILVALVLLVSVSFTAYAQDILDDIVNESTEGYTTTLGAKAGDLTGAILFGRGNYLNLPRVPSAPRNNTNWIAIPASVYANVTDVNSNSLVNMVGAEVRYFISDKIAINLSGGAILRNTPALQNVQYFYAGSSTTTPIQGNDPSTNNAGWVPQYGSVVADNSNQMNVNLGGEFHFPSKRFERLFPYVGLTVNYYNSRRAMYDPSVYYSNTGSGTGGSGVLVYDIGVRTALIQGLGAQVVTGIDVYIGPGVYIGVATRPVSFLYTWSEVLPAPGLESVQSEATTMTFLSQTFFKLGFILN